MLGAICFNSQCLTEIMKILVITADFKSFPNFSSLYNKAKFIKLISIKPKPANLPVLL